MVWAAASFAALFAFFAFLGFHARDNLNLGVVCLAAAAWGAGIFLLVYRGMVRRRVIKYVTGQLKGSWPRATTFEIAGRRLLWTAAGSTVTLELAELTRVAEERDYLELWFGERLCVIPLRAFASANDKIVFLDLLGYSRNK